MVRAHHPTPEFPTHLLELYRRFPFERSLAADPLSCVRPYAGDRPNAEIAGIFAATLAIGSTTAIRGAFAKFRAIAGDDLLQFVLDSGRRNARLADAGFKHRWIRGDQLDYLAERLRVVYASHRTLEDVFGAGLRSSDGSFAAGLGALSDALRSPRGAGPPPPDGYDRLFPNPLEGRSPCKRLALFARWMVRTDYPDLGLWTRVPASELRIPLDHHVFWIAYHLGLTARRTPSWAAVEEITAALRAIDPNDPVKYDFVLCHTGISGDCPKHRDLSVCGRCVVRPDCRLWRGRRAS